MDTARRNSTSLCATSGHRHAVGTTGSATARARSGCPAGQYRQQRGDYTECGRVATTASNYYRASQHRQQDFYHI